MHIMHLYIPMLCRVSFKIKYAKITLYYNNTSNSQNLIFMLWSYKIDKGVVLDFTHLKMIVMTSRGNKNSQRKYISYKDHNLTYNHYYRAIKKIIELLHQNKVMESCVLSICHMLISDNIQRNTKITNLLVIIPSHQRGSCRYITGCTYSHFT